MAISMSLTLDQVVSGVTGMRYSASEEITDVVADAPPCNGQIVVNFGDGSIQTISASHDEYVQALRIIRTQRAVPGQRPAYKSPRSAEAISSFLNQKYRVRIDTGDVEAIMHDFAVYACDVMAEMATAEPGP